MLLELERRGCQVAYVRTADRFQVDFHVRTAEGETLLIQVCSQATDAGTIEREVQAMTGVAWLLGEPVAGRPTEEEGAAERTAAGRGDGRRRGRSSAKRRR